MIEGVTVRTLKKIPDDRGTIMHMLKKSDPEYKSFGEIYFSTVYPGVVKGWHLHRKMTLHYAVISGMIKLVLYDDRKKSKTQGQLQELYIGDQNYCLVCIPPDVWNGFMGVGTEPSIVANCTDIPHDSKEILRMDPLKNDIIDYDWNVRFR